MESYDGLIEAQIQKLKEMNENELGNFYTCTTSAKELYVLPLGAMIPFLNENEDGSFKLLQTLIEKIDSTKMTCQTCSYLILADSGFGKTFFGHSLCNEYTSVNHMDRIPIYIYLPTFKENLNLPSLLESACRTGSGISEENIALITANYPLLIILDGFDELTPLPKNLLALNGWATEKSKYKDVICVTLSRSEALPKRSTRNELFHSGDGGNHAEYFLLGFTPAQVEEYIEKYSNFLKGLSLDEAKNTQWEMAKVISSKDPTWLIDKGTKYLKWLRKYPDINEMTRIPYILTLILQSLPGMVAKIQAGNDAENDTYSRIFSIAKTRVGIFNAFTRDWFNFQIKRLEAAGASELINGPDRLSTINLEYLFSLYASNLASGLVDRKSGRLIGNSFTEKETLAPHLIDGTGSKSQMSKEEVDKYFPKSNLEKCKRNLKVLRNGCLLQFRDGGYCFPHRSLIEFFAAKETFENVMGIMDVFTNEVGTEEYWGRESSILNRVILQESSMLRQLAESVTLYPEFSQLLASIIIKSKTLSFVSTIAANAITILNIAGISFSGQDFSFIQIPRANLSHSICGNTNFEGANLENVNFEHSWLNAANLAGSNLVNTQFDNLVKWNIDLPQRGVNLCCLGAEGIPSESIWIVSLKIESLGNKIKAMEIRFPMSLKASTAELDNVMHDSASADTHIGSSKLGENILLFWDVLGKRIHCYNFRTKSLDCVIDVEPTIGRMGEEKSLNVIGNPNGKSIAFMCCGKVFYINDLSNSTNVTSLQCSKKNDRVYEFSLAQKYLSIASREQIYLYTRDNDAGILMTHSVHSPERCTALLLEPSSGLKLGFGGVQGIVSVYSIKELALCDVMHLQSHPNPIRSLAFSHSISVLASASQGIIQVSELERGTVLAILDFHLSTAFDGNIVFSQDDFYLGFVSKHSWALTLWAYGETESFSVRKTKLGPIHTVARVSSIGGIGNDLVAVELFPLDHPGSIYTENESNAKSIPYSYVDFYNINSGSKVGRTLEIQASVNHSLDFIDDTRVLVCDSFGSYCSGSWNGGFIQTGFLQFDETGGVLHVEISRVGQFVLALHESAINLWRFTIGDARNSRNENSLTFRLAESVKHFDFECWFTNAKINKAGSMIKTMGLYNKKYCDITWEIHESTESIVLSRKTLEPELSIIRSLFMPDENQAEIFEKSTSAFSKAFGNNIFDLIKNLGLGGFPLFDYCYERNLIASSGTNGTVSIYESQGETCSVKFKTQVWFIVRVIRVYVFANDERLYLVVGGDMGNVCLVTIEKGWDSWKMLWSRLPPTRLLVDGARLFKAETNIALLQTTFNLEAEHRIRIIDSGHNRLYATFASLFQDIYGYAISGPESPWVNVNDCKNRLLSKDIWVVSALYSKPIGLLNEFRTGEQHAFLVFEGALENNRRFIIKADLTKETGSQFISIQISPWFQNIDNFRNMAANWHGQQWNISSTDCIGLVERIYRERWAEDSLYDRLNNNCATWCKRHLSSVGIKLGEAWYNFVGDVPMDMQRTNK